MLTPLSRPISPDQGLNNTKHIFLQKSRVYQHVVPANVAGGETSEGPIAGDKAPSGDEDDAAAIPSPKDCGTDDEGDETSVADGGGPFL